MPKTEPYRRQLREEKGTENGSPVIIQLWETCSPKGQVRYKLMHTGKKDFYCRDYKRVTDEWYRRLNHLDVAP